MRPKNQFSLTRAALSTCGHAEKQIPVISLKGDKAHPGVFDNAKIKRFVPEFRGRTPFRVGVPESVRWLREHPEQQNLGSSRSRVGEFEGRRGQFEVLFDGRK